MKYRIFQVKGDSLAEHAFLPFDEKRPPNRKAYHQTWEGGIVADTDISALDHLFWHFNQNRPAGFRSYSLSVGDVILLEGERAWYCDTVGWQRLANAKPWQLEVKQ